MADRKKAGAKKAKTASTAKSQEARRSGLTEVLGRALIDNDFRSELLADPGAVAKRHGLSEQDEVALKNVDKAQLENAAGQLAGRSDFTVAVGVSVKF